MRPAGAAHPNAPAGPRAGGLARGEGPGTRSGLPAGELHHEVLEAQLAAAHGRTVFMLCDAATITAQIGPRVLASVSGGRALARETGARLPVSNGYSVTIDLAANDTYVVRRIFRGGRKEWIKSERTQVHAEDLSDAVYYASCFTSYTASEWPKRHS